LSRHFGAKKKAPDRRIGGLLLGATNAVSGP